MICRKSSITLSILFTFILSLGYCFAEQGNQKEKNIPKNKNIAVRAEPVNTDTGFTVGFRVKIINLSQEKSLVFVLRDNIYSLFNVQLINEKGTNVTPAPNTEACYKRGPNSPKKYKLKTIAPGSGYILFVPVPHQSCIDRRKISTKKNSQGHTVIDLTNLYNKNDLHITPNGKYTAKIYVNFAYYTHDKNMKNIPKYPNYKYYKSTLPDIPVQIDSKLFNLDIEKIYQKNKK